MSPRSDTNTFGIAHKYIRYSNSFYRSKNNRSHKMSKSVHSLRDRLRNLSETPRYSLQRFRNVSKFWVDPIDSVSFAIKHVTCSAEEQPQILVSPCPKLGAYTPLRSLIYDDDNGVKESDQYPNPILKLWSSCGKKSILSLRLLTVSYELKIFAMN